MDRHTSDPYAFLKYNTEEKHTTHLLINMSLMYIHTPDRVICTHKVKEEREEIVSRQTGTFTFARGLTGPEDHIPEQLPILKMNQSILS